MFSQLIHQISIWVYDEMVSYLTFNQIFRVRVSVDPPNFICAVRSTDRTGDFYSPNRGSSPLRRTIFNAPVAQSWWEHPPYKWEVMGSIPHQEYQFQHAYSLVFQSIRLIIDRSSVRIRVGVPISKRGNVPRLASETPNLAGWVRFSPPVPFFLK